MRNFVVFLLVGIAVHAHASWAAAAPAPSSAKISPALQSSLAKSGSVEILISFGGTGNALSQVSSRSFVSREDKLRAIVAKLQNHAAPYQTKALNFLNARSLEKVVSLWISNQIYVKGATAEIVAALAELDEVSYIQENEYIPLEKKSAAPAPGKSQSPRGNGILAEWNVEAIRAPEVWAAPNGNTGEGAMVATIDTGVRGTHEALRSNYGGQWLDPYTGSAQPIDANGQGTHTMGILAGSGGIGVAPGARWIACRGCDTASCGNAQLLQCGQFMVCPNSDCSAAPDVVSNGWGGGRGNTFYDSVIQAWHTAGVVPVWTVGNSGPGCGTANSPGDSSAGVLTVCALAGNGLSSFSSRGPSPSGDIKPDICAPSGQINSAYHTSDTAYAVLSGSSGAPPHVAGTVALLRSHRPNLNFQGIKTVLISTANKNLLPPTGQNCGGIPDSEFPNNSYGAGKVDAFAAFSAL